MKTYKSNIKEYRLLEEPTDISKVKLTQSTEVYQYVKRMFLGTMNIFESMYLVTLNRNNNTKGYVQLSKGGLAGTVADLRLIAHYCIKSLSCGCILVHNHPSGNIYPSQADLNLTNKVKEALELLDIKLIDHLIVTDESYYSLADNGNI